MDESTRTTALDKADAIAHKIGYPDFVVKTAELDQYYQQVIPLFQLPQLSNTQLSFHDFFYLFSVLRLLTPFCLSCG